MSTGFLEADREDLLESAELESWTTDDFVDLAPVSESLRWLHTELIESGSAELLSPRLERTW